MEKFFDKLYGIDKNKMRDRIKSTCSALGWQETIEYILINKIPFKNLKVAEIGCGTGTFSLTLSFLGANTTLIDADEDALSVAKRVFTLYGRNATFIKADVLDSIPENLVGCFDIVISGGLAEHFIGDDREKCIYFHKALLKKGGFAYIGVPNKLSILYQIVRLFKIITKRWSIKIEKPFTYWELKNYAKRIGFVRNEVIGNYPLTKDIIEYSLGLISAILDVIPTQVRQLIKVIKPKISTRYGSHYKISEKHMILNKIKYVEENLSVKKKSLKDFFSAGLILFGFVDSR